MDRMLEKGVSGSTVSAADISRNFGDWQSKALQSPVTITHHGRPRLILASVDAFQAAPFEASRPGGVLANQLRTVLNQMREAFYALGPDLRIIDINPAAELYINATRDSVMGQDIRDSFPDLRESIAWDFFTRVMRTGEQAEFKLRSRLRANPMLNVRVFPYDGGGVGVIWTAVEGAEEASVLKTQRDALFEALSHEPSFSVLILNVRGGIERTNASFCRLTEFDQSQLQSLTLAELVSPGDRTDLLQTLNATVREGRPKGLVVQLMVREGSQRQVRLTMSAAAHNLAAEEIIVCALDLEAMASLTAPTAPGLSAPDNFARSARPSPPVDRFQG